MNQVLYEDRRARAFFVDCIICELSQSAGVQVTDAGGRVHSLTCRCLVCASTVAVTFSNSPQ